MSAPQLVPADHAALWTPAKLVDDETRRFHQHTIGLMRDAVAKIGAAGLAAPQLGLGLRMFVTLNPVCPVVINPRWTQIGDAFISKPERCLSSMAHSPYVRRPAKIHAEWLDADGEPKSFELESMDARVFMHLEQILSGHQIFPRPAQVARQVSE